MKNTRTKVCPVCIAGAHRSGTSMVTRLLHETGLGLGLASDLMPPQADNPDGFWENLRFVAINDEVLNELGGAWDLPPAADENFQHERLLPVRLKAEVLIESFGRDMPWGWKDPRNSLTLPFWRDLLPKLKIVVMVRNPLEVAYSMHKRNGTSYAFGLRLWELYNRRLLAATTSDRRLIANYDAFFADPERELRRIAAFIGLPEERIPAAVSLVARGRRHTSFTVDQLVDARVAPEIIALYRDMIGIATDENGAEESSFSDPAEASADLLPGLPNRLRVSVPQREEFREELAVLRGKARAEERLREELPHLRQISQQEGRIRELQESLARKDSELKESLTRKDSEIQESLARKDSELREHLARKDSELHEAVMKLGRVYEGLLREEAERKGLHEHLRRVDQRLQQSSLTLSERERRIAELTDHLRQQLHATEDLARFLNDATAAAARLRRSRRWKLANPVLALRNTLFGRLLLGPGDLEAVVGGYAAWKEAHPEVNWIEAALQDLEAPPDRTETLPAPPPEPSPPPYIPPAPVRPIEFPVHEEIEISIVIPVFNQLPFTQACLASIQEHAGSERFEVIVVDDSSTDATSEELSRVPGLVYLRNETNAGFIASCNRGAKQARGKFLVFLNSDTQVTAGWLSALRETFDLHPGAGLVGSKLVFPDGRLQEAGGIIWNDATGWNYGKFDDPKKPEYNFLREVDYCSGACLMVAKALFESLGGFDSKYAPAYYEDTDLAFKVRDRGLKVLYQPLSKVIHFEGASCGTDLANGTKRYQEINRSTFASTWADALAQQPVNGDLAAHRASEPGQHRILVIDHHLPMPDRDSGSLRMFQILKILRELGHQVTFIPDNLADLPPYTGALQKLGIEVVFFPHVESVRAYLVTHGSQFEFVILSRCNFAGKHIADVRLHAPQSRVIFDTVDLHFLRQKREAELLGDAGIKQKALELEAREYDLIDQADETWVVSDFELELLRRERPRGSIEIVSNIVDIGRADTPFVRRRDFLFIGGFNHPPNVDAVIFFAQDIYPLIKRHLPDVRFFVIGEKAPPAVTALACENVIVTGLQPDVRPYFDGVKLSIAPLRWGAGVKGKINQSMGFGVPMVATSVATEGMGLKHRHDILIADTIEAFADAMIELYETEDLWTRLSENGLETTAAKYSSDAARKQLGRLLSEGHCRPPTANSRQENGQTSP